MSFYGATFSENANFARATFSAGARFSGVTFSGSAKFDSATFGGYASFNVATFSQYALFEQATFSEDVWFNGTTFSGKAYFQRAQFKGHTDFDNAIFEQAPLFQGATLFADTHFDDAVFPDPSGNAHAMRAYRTLKFAFSKEQATREEQRFFKLEMEEEALIALPLRKWWKKSRVAAKARRESADKKRGITTSGVTQQVLAQAEATPSDSPSSNASSTTAQLKEKVIPSNNSANNNANNNTNNNVGRVTVADQQPSKVHDNSLHHEEPLLPPRFFYTLYRGVSDYGFSTLRPLWWLVVLPLLVMLLLSSFLHGMQMAFLRNELVFEFNLLLMLVGQVMSHAIPFFAFSPPHAEFLALFGGNPHKISGWYLAFSFGATVQKLLALLGWFLVGLALRNQFKMK